MSSRDEFYETLRNALGRPSGAGLSIAPETIPLSPDAGSVEARASSAMGEAQERADELMSELESSAKQIGWAVFRASSPDEAAKHIDDLARDLEARSIVRSGHAVLDRLRLADRLERAGVDVRLLAVDDAGDKPSDRQRAENRGSAIAADMGLTGVDFAIAETGSCVLFARKGVSRLVSLVPPVHVAVVEKGQVLPGLDELFLLRRQSYLRGEAGSYMNIISGPSRSGDIEQKLITGVHGPREVHMVLLG